MVLSIMTATVTAVAELMVGERTMREKYAMYAIIVHGSDGPGKHATSGPGVIWTKHISPTDPGHLIATSIILIQPRDPGRMVLHLLLFVVSTKYSTY